MGRYRKKPVVIEAWRWLFNEHQEPDPVWMRDALGRWPEVGGITFEPEHPDGPRISIATTEGVIMMVPGMRIIRGVKGELYSCAADVFETTHEAADRAPAPDLSMVRADQLVEELGRRCVASVHMLRMPEEGGRIRALDMHRGDDEKCLGAVENYKWLLIRQLAERNYQAPLPTDWSRLFGQPPEQGT